MLKFLKKTKSIWRRFKLGKAFKHQYNCNPLFNLTKNKDTCDVFWNHQKITTLPRAHVLQNQFSGPCFIVASGPSIADIDLKQLSAHHTISLNCAIKKFSDEGMQPTHCIIADHRVLERQWSCVETSILSGANCFFTFEGLNVICERNPDLLLKGNVYLIESISRKYGEARKSADLCFKTFSQDKEIFLDPTLPALCRAIGFSCNLEKGVFSGKTVATWAVQLSLGLGYQAIYILGMDLGGTGKAHFYADQHNPTPDFLPYYEPHIRACFELARKACQENSVDIYNLSLLSTLPHDIIPKMTYAEALQRHTATM